MATRGNDNGDEGVIKKHQKGKELYQNLEMYTT
jgi:hypothetical protein